MFLRDQPRNLDFCRSNASHARMQSNIKITNFGRNEVDVTQPIRLSFKHWLDALFIAQKYKKELKADSAEQSSETTNEDGTPTSKSIQSTNWT